MKTNSNKNTRDKKDLDLQNQSIDLDFDDLPHSPIETQAFIWAVRAAAIFLAINLFFSMLDIIISNYIRYNLAKNTGIELNTYIASARDNLEIFAKNREYRYWLSLDLSTKQLQRFLENNEIAKNNRANIEILSVDIKQLQDNFYEIDKLFDLETLKKHHTYKETMHPYAHSYYFMAAESKESERRNLKKLEKIIIEAKELLEEVRQVNRTYKDRVKEFKEKEKREKLTPRKPWYY